MAIFPEIAIYDHRIAAIRPARASGILVICRDGASPILETGFFEE